MRCPHCGAEVPEGDLFCGECGKQMVPDEPSPRAIAPWVIVVVVVGGLVVVGGGAVALLRPSPSPTPAPTATPTATFTPTSTAIATATPTPTATFTPVPTPTTAPVSQPAITSLVSAPEIDDEGNPLNVTDVFRPGTTEVFFVFQYKGFAGITEMEVVFYHNGVETASGTINLTGEDSGQASFRYYDDDVFPPGEYTLVGYVQDQSLGTYQFTILGATLALEDDFSDETSGWVIDETDFEKVWYENGQLHVLTKEEDWTAGTFFAGQPQDTFSNLWVEVDVSVIALPEAGAYYGINTRGDERNGFLSFYWFVIEPGGYYGIFKLGEDDLVPLVDWTESEAIKQGADVVNRLQIECLGPFLRFYVNGTFLDEVEDTSFATGTIGLTATSVEGGREVHVVFDNIVVYNIE